MITLALCILMPENNIQNVYGINERKTLLFGII